MWKFLPASSPYRLRVRLGTTCWDCKKEFRLTRTIFSHVSDSRGIRDQTARPSCALLTVCSMTILCLDSTSSAMLRMGLRAANWHSLAHLYVAVPATPGI